QLGKRIGVFVRLDERQLGGRQLLLDHDWLVFRRAARLKSPHPRQQAVVVDVQAVGDGLQMVHLQRVARKQEREGGMIVDDDASVAIENLPAGGQDRNRLDAVLFGPLLVNLRIPDLKVPETGDQEQENPDHQVLEKRDFAGGEFRV